MPDKHMLYTPALIDINSDSDSAATGRSAAPIVAATAAVVVPTKQTPTEKPEEPEGKAPAQQNNAGVIPPANCAGQAYVVVQTDKDWASLFWLMGNDIQMQSDGRRAVFVSSGDLRLILARALQLKAYGAKIGLAEYFGDGLVDKEDWQPMRLAA